MRNKVDVERLKGALAALGPEEFLRRAGRDPKRDGSGVKDCCPWHNENTPSCNAKLGSDGTLMFHCFGCGKSGDALGYLSAINGLDPRRDFKRIVAVAADIANVALDDPTPARPTPPREVAASPRKPVPQAEVDMLYAACGSVYDDAEVAAYLRSRSIDPALVVDRCLARALPADEKKLFRWARFKGTAPKARGWAETGHRLILPMYGPDGRIVTVRARRIVDNDTPKALPPAGHTIPPSVMADSLGRLLLEDGKAPNWWKQGGTVIVSEGEPDFLTVATYFGDDESAPAVLGLVGGGQRLRRGGPQCGTWSADIAARIPDGSTVVIRTHMDEAGHQYAAAIAETIGTRCRLLRRGE